LAWYATSRSIRVFLPCLTSQNAWPPNWKLKRWWSIDHEPFADDHDAVLGHRDQVVDRSLVRAGRQRHVGQCAGNGNEP